MTLASRKGRHLVLEAPMVMVGSDPVEVERALLAGELSCPDCSGVLRPWGHARWRSSRRERGTVRHRPRRSACSGCGRTHVLVPACWLPRRADAVAVIGAALLAKAAGAGHRPIATAQSRCRTYPGWTRWTRTRPTGARPARASARCSPAQAPNRMPVKIA